MKNKRKVYEDGLQGDTKRCALCGCGHFEYHTRAIVKGVAHITRKCRHCGDETSVSRVETPSPVGGGVGGDGGADCV